MGINWKVRMRNPVFWIGLFCAIGAPVLAYKGISATDLTTWDSVGDLLMELVTNPYLLASTILSVFSAFGIAIDPTTAGISDSTQAMGYLTPKED